jgi:hypothetical protein
VFLTSVKDEPNIALRIVTRPLMAHRAGFCAPLFMVRRICPSYAAFWKRYDLPLFQPERAFRFDLDQADEAAAGTSSTTFD